MKEKKIHMLKLTPAVTEILSDWYADILLRETKDEIALIIKVPFSKGQGGRGQTAIDMFKSLQTYHKEHTE